MSELWLCVQFFGFVMSAILIGTVTAKGITYLVNRWKTKTIIKIANGNRKNGQHKKQK